MLTDDTQERSRYWLSPGIDVPTRAEVTPGMRQAKGLYICDHSAEAAFVPTDAFMSESPLRRLDVLGDIAEHIRRVQQHAAVELFRELSQRGPDAPLEQKLLGFRESCNKCGVELPQNVDALIILDQQFATRVP